MNLVTMLKSSLSGAAVTGLENAVFQDQIPAMCEKPTIAITEKMVSAGVIALRASGFLERDSVGDAGLVRMIVEIVLADPLPETQTLEDREIAEDNFRRRFEGLA